MASLMEIMQLCRLCLVKDQVNIPIFEEQGDIRQIFLKISACLPVKVSREDNLPKKICDGCSYKLEILYQFWNTSANSEKQLLKWLSQVGAEKSPTSDKVAVAPVQPHSMPSDGVILKQEVVDLADSHSADEIAPDDLNVSSDAQDYILQQQQLPYQPIAFQFPQDGFAEGEGATNASGPSATVTSEAAEATPPKRKRRAAAMKALPPQIDSEEEDEDDVDMVETKIAKTEEQTDESGGEDPEPTAFVGVPSTSTDNEQPGPSGVGKGSAEAPLFNFEAIWNSGALEWSDDETSGITSGLEVKVEPSSQEAFAQKREVLCKCYMCGKMLKFPETFDQHLKTHEVPAAYKTADAKPEETSCKVCGKTVKFPDSFSKHMQEHARNSEYIKSDELEAGNSKVRLGGYSVVCRQCDKVYYTRSEFIRHINTVHKKIYTCDVCNQCCGNYISFALHKRLHSRVKKVAIKEPKEGQRHKCSQCDKHFSYLNNLRHHLRSHHNIEYNKELNFTCDICDKVLSSALNLSNHKRLHLLYPNRCTYCRKCVAKPGFLKRHMKKHVTSTNEKQFKCKKCNKTFAQQNEFRIHRKYHRL